MHLKEVRDFKESAAFYHKVYTEMENWVLPWLPPAPAMLDL